MNRKKFDTILTYLILSAVLLVVITPLIYTVASSFKTNSEIMADPGRIFPENPTLENYAKAWTSDVFDIKNMLFNSIYYTIVCLCATVLISTMSGYVFARGEFRGKQFWLAAFSVLMFFSMGSVTIYPMMDILKIIHIPKNLHGLVFIRIFGLHIVNIYLVRSYVNSLPKELDESAEIDGCSFAGIFFRIIAPLLKPIMATIGILAFQSSWNDYLMPMIFTLGAPKQRPLIVGLVALSQSGESAASWNLVLAGTTVSLIPVLMAYAFGNRYFLSGLSAGAVKG